MVGAPVIAVLNGGDGMWHERATKCIRTFFRHTGRGNGSSTRAHAYRKHSHDQQTAIQQENAWGVFEFLKTGTGDEMRLLMMASRSTTVVACSCPRFQLRTLRLKGEV